MVTEALNKSSRLRRRRLTQRDQPDGNRAEVAVVAAKAVKLAGAACAVSARPALIWTAQGFANGWSYVGRGRQPVHN